MHAQPRVRVDEFLDLPTIYGLRAAMLWLGQTALDEAAVQHMTDLRRRAGVADVGASVTSSQVAGPAGGGMTTSDLSRFLLEPPPVSPRWQYPSIGPLASVRL